MYVRLSNGRWSWSSSCNFARQEPQPTESSRGLLYGTRTLKQQDHRVRSSAKFEKNINKKTMSILVSMALLFFIVGCESLLGSFQVLAGFYVLALCLLFHPIPFSRFVPVDDVSEKRVEEHHERHQERHRNHPVDSGCSNIIRVAISSSRRRRGSRRASFCTMALINKCANSKNNRRTEHAAPLIPFLNR